MAKYATLIDSEKVLWRNCYRLHFRALEDTKTNCFLDF